MFANKITQITFQESDFFFFLQIAGNALFGDSHVECQSPKRKVKTVNEEWAKNFNLDKQGGRSCAKGLLRKVWTQKKIFNPNIRYFVAILRFVAISEVRFVTAGSSVKFLPVV